uniref:Reverse transcriptase domain-containing protein n=1 Tax=Macrostomum lignano TaxID=282301 RepID=A0A1I8F626_9PLAT
MSGDYKKLLQAIPLHLWLLGRRWGQRLRPRTRTGFGQLVQPLQHPARSSTLCSVRGPAWPLAICRRASLPNLLRASMSIVGRRAGSAEAGRQRRGFGQSVRWVGGGWRRWRRGGPGSLANRDIATRASGGCRQFSFYPRRLSLLPRRRGCRCPLLEPFPVAVVGCRGAASGKSPAAHADLATSRRIDGPDSWQGASWPSWAMRARAKEKPSRPKVWTAGPAAALTLPSTAWRACRGRPSGCPQQQLQQCWRWRGEQAQGRRPDCGDIQLGGGRWRDAQSRADSHDEEQKEAERAAQQARGHGGPPGQYRRASSSLAIGWRAIFVKQQAPGRWLQQKARDQQFQHALSRVWRALSCDTSAQNKAPFGRRQLRNLQPRQPSRPPTARSVDADFVKVMTDDQRQLLELVTAELPGDKILQAERRLASLELRCPTALLWRLTTSAPEFAPRGPDRRAAFEGSGQPLSRRACSGYRLAISSLPQWRRPLWPFRHRLYLSIVDQAGSGRDLTRLLIPYVCRENDASLGRPRLIFEEQQRETTTVL